MFQNTSPSKALGASAAAVLLTFASLANAQLAGLRGTIPGSLHQCESTNMFFFDSSNTRPLTVLFLPTDSVPNSARTGTVSLTDAASYNPLQVIQGISTPDAAPYDFTLGLEAGSVFEVFAFLENGEGKALSLTRTVSTALPAASSCLGNVQTTVSGVNAAAAPTSTSTSTSSSSSSTSSSTTSSSSTTAQLVRSTTSAPSSSSTTSSGPRTRTTTLPTTLAAANTDPATLSSIPTGAASRGTTIAMGGAAVAAAAVAGAVALF